MPTKTKVGQQIDELTTLHFLTEVFLFQYLAVEMRFNTHWHTFLTRIVFVCHPHVVVAVHFFLILFYKFTLSFELFAFSSNQEKYIGYLNLFY